MCRWPIWYLCTGRNIWIYVYLFPDYFYSNSTINWDGDFLYGMIGLLQGEFQMKMGQITTYFSTSEIATVNSRTGNCSYIPMPGQESGVFVPSNIYGVVSTSDRQEEAMDFVRFLLSKEVQTQNLYFPAAGKPVGL